MSLDAPIEQQEGLLKGLCHVLGSPSRTAAARLQALHHINALSTHSDATRNAVVAHVLQPLITALSDAEVSVHCEAASVLGNLMFYAAFLAFPFPSMRYAIRLFRLALSNFSSLTRPCSLF